MTAPDRREKDSRPQYEQLAEHYADLAQIQRQLDEALELARVHGLRIRVELLRPELPPPPSDAHG